MSQPASIPLPVEGMAVTPYGWGDPILSGAFMGCVNFATRQQQLVDQFEQESGLKLSRLVAASPIEKMVDDATGFSRELVAKWFDWVALNVWGDGSEPEDETP